MVKKKSAGFTKNKYYIAMGGEQDYVYCSKTLQEGVQFSPLLKFETNESLSGDTGGRCWLCSKVKEIFQFNVWVYTLIEGEFFFTVHCK